MTRKVLLLMVPIIIVTVLVAGCAAAQKLVVQEKQGRMSQAMDEINKQKAPLPGLLAKMKGLVG